MGKSVTDRQILRAIFDFHSREYPGKIHQGKPENDPYVPINVAEIARRLDQQPELLFGRLYYHLDAKHRYNQANGAEVHLFGLEIGGRRHVIHFPYLVALLAREDEERRTTLWSLWLSILALALATASLAVDLFVRAMASELMSAFRQPKVELRKKIEIRFVPLVVPLT